MELVESIFNGQSTFPSLMHSNGPMLPLMSDFRGYVQQTAKDWKVPSELTIITTAISDPSSSVAAGKRLDYFESQCQELNLPVTVVRQRNGIHWNIKIDAWLSLLGRIETPYVVFADGADCIWLRSPERLLEDYLAHWPGRQLVWQGEPWPGWPAFPRLAMHDAQHPEATSGGLVSINSGLCIGPADELFQLVEEASRLSMAGGNVPNDQPLIRLAAQSRERVVTDSQQRLFCLASRGAGAYIVRLPETSAQQTLRNLLRELPQVQYGAEIGVLIGQTSAFLLREFPQLRLAMVDPWKVFNDPSDVFDKFDQNSWDYLREQAWRMTDHVAARRMILQNTSRQAAMETPDASLDFVFIDASHMYPSVMVDLQVWWPKVKPGGLFCGHDYQLHEGVWGVKRAVDQFCSDRGVTPKVAPGDVWYLYKDRI